MKVELFYIAECPNHREAARMLRETLRDCGFRDRVSEIEVADSHKHRRLRLWITLYSDRGEGYRTERAE
jgi:hypothetical protein